MNLICLDLEGVLVPEIWLRLAASTGIQALERTTRDEPDYNLLMRQRLDILREHQLTISDVRQVIGEMAPFPGGLDFLNRLRQERQVIILSDTFHQFAPPLVAQLNWPTLFCNDLVIDAQGVIQDFRLRQKGGKQKAVQAFQSMNLTVLACGDAYNDIAMIQQADRGCFFRPPASILKELPGFPAFIEYNDLLEFILAEQD